nr:unnamed protein product [Callosobruchus analis]
MKKFEQFFENESNGGISYDSLNSYRSALALAISPKLANDFRVIRFFKGMYKLHPPMPRYDSTWDPDIVLSYLKTLYPNETISLEKLAKRTVTLLVLITAHRVQTLSYINNICKNCNRLEILIASRIKTSSVNRLQPCLYIPYFLEDGSICAATTLEAYIERTNQYRGGHNSKLFLTYKRPIKEGTSQSISRWIKSSIDTSIFSAHSTMHASTSAARRRALNLDLIRKTAGWTKRSMTFAKFYDRPLNQDRTLFANTIYNVNTESTQWIISESIWRLCGVSASKTIKRVSHAIALQRPQFINMSNDYVQEAREKFYQIARFPSALVSLTALMRETAELFRNRKGYFSITVQTIVDADLKIRDIVARWAGPTHEVSHFTFSEILHFIIALKLLITPLLQTNTEGERLFNESLIRTGITVERTYGVWIRRFPALAMGICLHRNVTLSAIVASAILHNIACDERDSVRKRLLYKVITFLIGHYQP